MLLAGACSVTTPRNGFTTQAGRSRTGASQRGANGNAALEGTGSGDALGPGAAPPVSGAAGSQSASSSGGAQATNAGAVGTATSPAGTSSASRPGSTRPAGSRNTVGVTKDSITISVLGGFNGPLAAFAQAVYPGFQTWADDVNAHGGVHGRRIIVKKVGHGDTDDGAIAACKEVLSNGSMIATWIVGDRMDPGIDCLDKAGFPSLTVEGQQRYYSHWKHAYGATIYPFDLGRVLPSLVRDQMGDGNKKLGVIYSAGGAFEEVSKSYVAAAKAAGMNVVDTEAVTQTQASFTSQLLRLRDRGVENVAVLAALEIIGIFRDAQVIGYHPHFTGYGLTIDTFMQACRCPYARGSIALRAWTTIDTPAFTRFKAKMNQYGRGGQADGNTAYTYADGLILQKALETAGPDPSRESLIAGIESIKGYDNGLVAPITWGPGAVIGSDAVFPVICCDANYNWQSHGPASNHF